MKYFFSGKPCPLGHITKRIVLSGGCWDCQLIRNATWRKSNPDKVRANTSRSYQRHRTKRCAAKKHYRQTTPDYAERHRESAKQWRLDHPEQYRAIRNKYLSKARKTEAYRLANRANSARRKMRRWRRPDGSPVYKERLAALLRRHNGKCYWCRKSYGETYHLDHVMPLAIGGEHDITNLVVSCPTCNLKKGVKTPMEWAGVLL